MFHMLDCLGIWWDLSVSMVLKFHVVHFDVDGMLDITNTHTFSVVLEIICIEIFVHKESSIYCDYY